VELHNGNWTVRYLEDVLEADGTIKRHNRRKYLGGAPPKMTEKMAHRMAEPIMAEVNCTTKPKQMATFNEFLARWTPMCMPKTETARNFKSSLNKYLVPAFGKKQLSEIQTEDLQRFVSQTKTGAGNLHNVMKVFRTVWKSAKAWGYVKHNPFVDVIMPPIKKAEQRFFSEAELCRILTAAPEPFRTLYWILAQTGLRIGEVLALTWECVNVELGTIEVRGSVARGKLREGETKSDAAKRLIPISPRLTEHLAIYQTKIWTANDLNLLFANGEGKPWHADSLLDRIFQPFLESLGIEKAGFHAFRHASATILSRMKVPMEIRRARMGHTDEEMTLRYTHVIDEDARLVASNFDQFLLPETVLEAGA
jgi:integrase